MAKKAKKGFPPKKGKEEVPPKKGFPPKKDDKKGKKKK
jgi:hypothetical protein